jgi:hypothetical protein
MSHFERLTRNHIQSDMRFRGAGCHRRVMSLESKLLGRRRTLSATKGYVMSKEKAINATSLGEIATRLCADEVDTIERVAERLNGREQSCLA